jgi:signal transduction histidine kinase
MTENEIKIVAPAETPAVANVMNFSELGDNLCAIARGAVVSYFDGRVCAATLQTNEEAIKVSTRIAISKEHQKEIVAGMAVTRDNGLKDDAACIINNCGPGEYVHDKATGSFVDQTSMPLTFQSVALGTLFIGSLDAHVRVAREEVLQLFNEELSLALEKFLRFSSRHMERYERMIARVMDGVVLCDAEQNILFINGAAAAILKVDADKCWSGEHLSELGAAYLNQFLEEAITQEIHEVNKVVNSSEKKGTLIGVHTELLKSRDNLEIGWMIVLRDVTMNWQNDQMRSALTIASHEIKTPLNSILAAVDLMLEQDLGQLNQNQQHCLNVVKDDTRRLNRLLTDMLDLSRFDEGVQFIDRRKQVSLGFLVAKVIETLRTFAKSKSIHLENLVPKSMPTFKGDRDRLQQVLSNLVENSIKYSLTGGSVAIGAELRGSILKCWVKDNGVGIPEEKYDEIFQRFQQLDNFPDQGHRGFGLGLSIARQIVEHAGGKLWVDSKVGIGSTFYFTVTV